MMKLVRDKIPDIIAKDHCDCHYIKVMDDDGFKRVLLQKLERQGQYVSERAA